MYRTTGARQNNLEKEGAPHSVGRRTRRRKENCGKPTRAHLLRPSGELGGNKKQGLRRHSGTDRKASRRTDSEHYEYARGFTADTQAPLWRRGATCAKNVIAGRRPPRTPRRIGTRARDADEARIKMGGKIIMQAKGAIVGKACDCECEAGGGGVASRRPNAETS